MAEGRDADIRPVARMARPGDDELEAVAAIADSHLVVVVTGMVDGRREVVSLEYTPLPSGFDPAAPGDFIEERMEQAVERARSSGTLTPLSAQTIRLPLSSILSYRPDVQIGSTTFELKTVSDERLSELTPRERMLVPYQDDALLYVTALRAGESPALAVSRVRGISVSYARNRIAKARALDLLTPAERSVAAGGLTETAERLLAWRDSHV